jgi:hypothetical protein
MIRGNRGNVIPMGPLRYLAEPSKVVYRAKDGTEEKVFDAPVIGDVGSNTNYY